MLQSVGRYHVCLRAISLRTDQVVLLAFAISVKSHLRFRMLERKIKNLDDNCCKVFEADKLA